MVNGVMVESPMVAGNTMSPIEKTTFSPSTYFKSTRRISDTRNSLTILGRHGVSHALNRAINEMTRSQTRRHWPRSQLRRHHLHHHRRKATTISSNRKKSLLSAWKAYENKETPQGIGMTVIKLESLRRFKMPYSVIFKSASP
jgi:hypothetical protein